jgi:FlaG/FlaF family flagellin (archaellin)
MVKLKKNFCALIIICAGLLARNPLKMSKSTRGSAAPTAPTYSTATATAIAIAVATATAPATAACGVSAAATAPSTPSATLDGRGERRDYGESMDESILDDDIEDNNGEG